MERTLYHAVLTRLLDAEETGSDAANLVDGACQGTTALESALADLGAGDAPLAPPAPPTGSSAPPSAYLDASGSPASEASVRRRPCS